MNLEKEMEPTNSDKPNNGTAKRPLIKVIIHSFFIVPFLIAVFGVFVFFLFRILTMEEHTAYDYLNGIKVGGVSRRWQAAYELSKIFNTPNAIPQDAQFVAELKSAFRQSANDDDRIRQYLALAMGRTGNKIYVDPLTAALSEEKEDNIPALLHALGLIGAVSALPVIYSFADHADASIRLQAVIAIGHIGDPGSLDVLKRSVHDPEPNIQWDAAVALAKIGDLSGRGVLLNLLDDAYLTNFGEVDLYERSQAMIVAIDAAKLFDDSLLHNAIKELSERASNMEVRKAALNAMNL